MHSVKNDGREATQRAAEAIRRLIGDGGPLDFGRECSRLLVRVTRALAMGRPVAREQVDRLIADVDIARDDAQRFLGRVTERDPDDNIVGILGLSLNETPHRFDVDGERFSTWCALDTLFLPAVLDRPATVESQSPVSEQRVRVTVTPDRVEEVRPAGAVISFVVVDPENADLSSVATTWGTFCHHIFFFATRAEAVKWAAGRSDIEILSVEDAFDLGRQIASRLLLYEE